MMKYCLILSLAVSVVTGNIILTSGPYIRLPDHNQAYTINSRTARESAFDEVTRFLYVAGRDTGMLHVIDYSTPMNATHFLTISFNLTTYGRPLDVELCRPAGFGTPILAISFDGLDSLTNIGEVGFYHPLSSNQDSSLTQVFQGDETFNVGAHPDNIKFASDCGRLVVANEGVPRLNGGVLEDPIGSVTIFEFHANGSNPTSGELTFTSHDSDGPYLDQLQAAGYRLWMTSNPDTGATTLFSQSIEPEYVAISPSQGYAYVSLQENNAIVRIDLSIRLDTHIYALGTKDWSTLDIDANDNGIVNFRSRKIKTYYQPDKTVFFTWNNVPYLLTLDEGVVANIPGSTFTDYARASTISWNTGDTTLNADLADNSILGRFEVDTNIGNTEPIGFGGRGMSIYDTRGLSLVRTWESGSQFERHSREHFPGTFNGEVNSFGLTPEQQVDATSARHGPQPSAVAVGSWLGHEIIIVGTEKNGLLYVYELTPNLDVPLPNFQSVHRAGSIIGTWNSLYTNSQMGDAGIRDIKISETGEKLIFVTSDISGSVSVYSFGEACWP